MIGKFKLPKYHTDTVYSLFTKDLVLISKQLLNYLNKPT